MTEIDAWYTLQNLFEVTDILEGKEYDLRNWRDVREIVSKLDRITGNAVRLQKENEQLKQQNKELKSDNDIKFWKHQFMMNYNETQLIMHELAKAIDNGYDVSSEFQKYLNELKARNNENREKMERLGI